MQFGTWDTLFNILLVLFWVEVWSGGDRSLSFNPYLAPLSRAGGAVVRFLSPVFFGLPDRVVALAAFAFVVVFRGVIVPGKSVWILTLGMDRQVDSASITSCLVFSLLSFAIFLFKLWGVSLVFVRQERTGTFDQTTGALYALSRPFTDLRVALRPAVLLVFGVLLVAALDFAGSRVMAPSPYAAGLHAGIGWGYSNALVIGLRLVILALAGWVQILPMVQSVMMLLIIGSWISMFTGSQGLMLLCREWIDFLLGPLRRYPIRIGMIDLSPIVFFFVLGFAHTLLMSLVVQSYNALA